MVEYSSFSLSPFNAGRPLLLGLSGGVVVVVLAECELFLAAMFIVEYGTSPGSKESCGKLRAECFRSRPVSVQACAGSAFSVFTPSSLIAFCAFLASNLPSRANCESAAEAMDSALISKCRRRYSRFSLRPKPSVPRLIRRPPQPGRQLIGNGFHEIGSGDDRPVVAVQRSKNVGIFAFSAGCRRFQRSTASASRRSSL